MPDPELLLELFPASNVPLRVLLAGDCRFVGAIDPYRRSNDFRHRVPRMLRKEFLVGSQRQPRAPKSVASGL